MRREIFWKGKRESSLWKMLRNYEDCIRKAGYLIVYDPYAELIHYESKSRGYEDTEEKIERFHGEVNLFQTRWKDFLKKGDPYYSPNLTLDHNDFGLNHLAKVERR